MNAEINSDIRKLGIFSLTILLVSAQYGLGFLLGTAEEVICHGIGGSLYAISLGFGFLFLLIMAKFYWQQAEPIWTLLGNRYGKSVKVGVGLMSWLSLIGIEAVQIIAGAAILAVIGINTWTGMVVLTLLFCLLSLLPLEKVSWILRGLLLLNILVLIYSLWALHGLPILVQSPIDFVTSLPQNEAGQELGLFLSTILLVMIDMKCQQYLVSAKDVRTALWSCLFASVILMGLALLLSTVAIAAQQAGIISPNLDAKEVIPYILTWVSGGTENFLGLVAIATLAVPALGLGSSVLRVQTKTFRDLEIIPQSLKVLLDNSKTHCILITVVNAILALVIALRGGEIVNLILFFYAIYISAVWIPFIAYLLDYLGKYTFSANSVKLALLVGSVSALGTSLLILLEPESIIFGSEQLTIAIPGMGMATISLLVMTVAERVLPLPLMKKEISN